MKLKNKNVLLENWCSIPIANVKSFGKNWYLSRASHGLATSNNNNGDKLIAFAQLRWRSRVAVSLGCWFCSLSFSFFSMRNQLFTYIKLLFAHDRALSVKKFASGGGIGPWVRATLLYVKTWKISLDALYIVLSVDFKWVKFIRTIYWFNFYLLLM